jgi:hypothetical protein
MKSFVMACAVSLLVAAPSVASELAVSKSTLGNMGLSSMERMSDDAGMAVRGKGTSAAVWGNSYASWALPAQTSGNFSLFGPPPKIAESTNSYQASASWQGKDSSAVGGSLSFAAQFAVEYSADPTGFTLGVAIAGGISGGGAFAAAM